MLGRTRLAAILTAVAAIGVLAGPVAQADTSVGASVSRTGAVLEMTRPVPVVGTGDPVISVVPTEVAWTRHTSWLTYGYRSLLEGQVVTVDGAVPNAAVKLYARPVGQSGWSYVATRRTSSATGIFRFDMHKPVRKTDYRVIYGPEWAYTASRAYVTVNVKRKITSTVTRNSDGTFTMTGSIAPKSAGKTVRLQRKKCGSCSYSTIKSITASSTSTYRFRFTGPTTRGTWYFRAYTPSDSGFLTSYSGYWTIRRS
ncbi:MAG: hypothetical protein GEU86_16885 [Actinophytocola sp.]|nr:hypothetical protein [Actinophytocola sp.]